MMSLLKYTAWQCVCTYLLKWWRFCWSEALALFETARLHYKSAYTSYKYSNRIVRIVHILFIYSIFELFMSLELYVNCRLNHLFLSWWCKSNILNNQIALFMVNMSLLSSYSKCVYVDNYGTVLENVLTHAHMHSYNYKQAFILLLMLLLYKICI